jgi:hypothetical protein
MWYLFPLFVSNSTHLPLLFGVPYHLWQVGHELDYLIAQLQANPLVNLTEDWKLLTLFIGANDLCIACTFANVNLHPICFIIIGRAIL